MKERNTLQIDVMEHMIEADMMECKLMAGSRTCLFYMSRSNYEALKYEGFFIRDGKEEDSAGVLNTTHVYDERI